ncbi:peptidyl-prolyl cis/trans isomerase [Purpureocillium lavendulum]|uniref:Peptidyl-prolyl cis/trans isomerase n=1 Tax=Purpureocillium lavendulum TaxID=1247861 RepID=A0AB34G709_9HYPO|nr:peptidyl-prolyl cis/trans isomerase [Purpureocillium lavendulum]
MADFSGKESGDSGNGSGSGSRRSADMASVELALFSRLFILSPDSPTIAIIGAGLTGLLAAHGLHKNGFKAVVFDKDPGPDVRERDWTMLMHWALPMLTELLPEDILADLPQAFCNPHLDFNEDAESLPCYNALTGTSCSGALSRMSKTEDGSAVVLEFEGGDKFEAERVLGADGVSSKARELLAGEERARVQRSGFLFATGITRYGDADKTEAIMKLHPVAALMMGTSSVGAVGTMAVDDPQDKSTWTTFWVKIWRGESVHLRDQEALNYIERETSALSGVFQSAIDWTPEGSRVFIDEMKYWVPVPWDNLGGRATLAGDAAHPMLIYRGQGLQHCITDVRNYVDSLVRVRGGADAAKVMQELDDEVVARGAKAVQQSLQEAEKSLDLETIRKMLMVTQGHGRSA